MFFVGIIMTTHSGAPIMATKCSVDTAGIEKAKRQRGSLTLEVQIRNFEEERTGRRYVCHKLKLGLAQSTVWTVLKNWEGHHLIEYVASER